MSRTSINRQCPHCHLRHAQPFASCGARDDDAADARAETANTCNAMDDEYAACHRPDGHGGDCCQIDAAALDAVKAEAGRAAGERIAAAIEADRSMPWNGMHHEALTVAARIARADQIGGA